MRVKTRVTSLTISPSDTSGFSIEVEVADASHLIEQCVGERSYADTLREASAILWGIRDHEAMTAGEVKAIDAATTTLEYWAVNGKKTPDGTTLEDL